MSFPWRLLFERLLTEFLRCHAFTHVDARCSELESDLLSCRVAELQRISTEACEQDERTTTESKGSKCSILVPCGAGGVEAAGPIEPARFALSTAPEGEPWTMSLNFFHCFTAGADVQLFVDVVDVVADGVDADFQGFRNGFVALSAEEEVEHRPLSDGKRFHLRQDWCGTVEDLDHLACNGRRHGRAAVHQFLNGFQDFRRRRLFQDVADGAGFQAMENFVGVLIHGDDHQQQRGAELFQTAGTVDSGHAGQLQIHQDDIRLIDREFLDGVLARRVSAEALKAVRVVENGPQSLSDLEVVFDDGNLDAHGLMRAKR